MLSLFLLILALVAIVAVDAFVLDPAAYDEEGVVEPVDKRDFQHIWRNLPMTSRSAEDVKRNGEGLSRGQANSFYRLG